MSPIDMLGKALALLSPPGAWLTPLPMPLAAAVRAPPRPALEVAAAFDTAVAAVAVLGVGAGLVERAGVLAAPVEPNARGFDALLFGVNKGAEAEGVGPPKPLPKGPLVLLPVLPLLLLLVLPVLPVLLVLKPKLAPLSGASGFLPLLGIDKPLLPNAPSFAGGGGLAGLVPLVEGAPLERALVKSLPKVREGAPVLKLLLLLPGMASAIDD